MATLSMNLDISHFSGVKWIGKPHPVFLLWSDDDNSTLVIKREHKALTPEPLKHTLKMMTLANPAAAGKVLKSNEVNCIRGHIEDAEYIAELVPEMRLSEDLIQLKNELTQQGTWFKMQYVPGLLSVKAAAEQLRLNADKTGVRKFAKALNDKGGFENLGRIVAADLYNDHHDRFMPRLPKYITDVSKLEYNTNERIGDFNPRLVEKGQKSRLRVTLNLGNVLIFLNRHIHQPIGLDSFDPNSYFSDLNKRVTESEADWTCAWSGRLLCRAHRDILKLLVQDIVDDLEDILGPRNRRYSFLSHRRLDKDGKERILKGIGQATTQIVAQLRSLINRPNPPVGLRERYDILTRQDEVDALTCFPRRSRAEPTTGLIQSLKAKSLVTSWCSTIKGR